MSTYRLRIEIDEGTEEEEHFHNWFRWCSAAAWWKPWSWGSGCWVRKTEAERIQDTINLVGSL